MAISILSSTNEYNGLVPAQNKITANELNYLLNEKFSEVIQYISYKRMVANDSIYTGEAVFEIKLPFAKDNSSYIAFCLPLTSPLIHNTPYKKLLPMYSLSEVREANKFIMPDVDDYQLNQLVTLLINNFNLSVLAVYEQDITIKGFRGKDETEEWGMMRVLIDFTFRDNPTVHTINSKVDLMDKVTNDDFTTLVYEINDNLAYSVSDRYTIPDNVIKAVLDNVCGYYLVQKCHLGREVALYLAPMD